MLRWLACQLAPKIPDLTAAPPPPLPEPGRAETLADRAREAAAALAAVPFRPRTDIDAHGALMALACRDLVTAEADQHPDTAGRTPNYAPYPEFQEVEIPGAGGVTLTGRHSVGPPGQPVVIVVHGLFDSHVSRYVVEHAVCLARMGFHAVALDMRDHGRLRGKKPPIALGVHEGKDLFAAAAALGDKEGVPVGILGLSFGGQCAVRAALEATKAGRPEVLRGGVLTLSAPLQIQEAICSLDDRTRLPAAHGFKHKLVAREMFGVLQRHLQLRLHEQTLAHPADDFEGYIREVVLPAYPDLPNLVGAVLGAARCTQPSVLGAVKVPVAVVHAADDFLVPVLHLREAKKAAGDNPFVTTRELPGGGHVSFGIADPAGTLGMLAAWFGTLR